MPVLSITFALQGAPAGGLDAASLFVVALLTAAVLLVWWASRPSTIARYPVREPDADAAGAAAPARPSAPLAPRESDHAGR